MSTEAVRLDVYQNCPLVSNETVTKRLIEIAVTASDMPGTVGRMPLNLALVIDRSGSMAGPKLQYVKQAVCHVLDCLQERDEALGGAWWHPVCSDRHPDLPDLPAVQSSR